jgi:hypothetical protein
MNKALIFGGIGLGLFYLTRKGLQVSNFTQNIKFSVVGATKAEFKYPNIFFKAHFQVDNPTSFSITIDKILTDVFMDLGYGYQLLASSIPNAQPVTILANQYNRFSQDYSINILNVGTSAFNLLKSGLPTRFKLLIKPKALYAGQWIEAQPYELSFP